jgi:hypothetical protein
MGYGPLLAFDALTGARKGDPPAHFTNDDRSMPEFTPILRRSNARRSRSDFPPHDLEFLRKEHAHRRLGFTAGAVTQRMSAAGLDVTMHRSLSPEPGSDGKVAVSLWVVNGTREVV